VPPLALTGYQIGLLCTALVFIAFALTVALVIPRARPDFPSKWLGWFIAGVIVLFVGQLTAVFLLANYGEAESAAAETTTSESTTTQTTTTPSTTTETTTSTTSQSTTTETTTTAATGGQGDPVAGKTIFLAQPCGGCHTLADAGTSGNVGPNLDAAKPPYTLVIDRVTNGKSPMPSFKGTLTEQQIMDVAAYVSSVAGK
jgi:mono/diheme cytochrome c family protein